MREILFRGKDTDEHWQYGDYIRYNEEFCNIKDTTIYRHSHLCKTKTVGQYTGIDKNGTKIFEGDVITNKNKSYVFIVKIGEYNMCNSSCESLFGVYLEAADDMTKKSINIGLRVDILYWLLQEEYAVIGNIHDNPELLKEREK